MAHRGSNANATANGRNAPDRLFHDIDPKGIHPYKREHVHLDRPIRLGSVRHAVTYSKVRIVKAGLIAGFSGLDVASVTEVRRTLREAGAEYKVVKNTLMKRSE